MINVNCDNKIDMDGCGFCDFLPNLLAANPLSNLVMSSNANSRTQ